MELHVAIKETISMFGCEIIQTERFVNILDDYQAFAENTAYKFIIKQLYNHKYSQIQKIKTLKDKNIDERTIRNELDNIAYYISYQLGFSVNMVRYAIDSFAYGIGVIHNIQLPGYNESTISNNVIGLWDFYYKDGECMTLTIRRDGTAIASSGTKYLWKCPSENEIIIYITGMVSYNGIINKNTIRGVAYNELYFREWEWHAEFRGDGILKSNLTDGKWRILNHTDDLEDNIIEFFSDGKLSSSVYGDGTWFIEGDSITIRTANDFITYIASMNKGKIIGNAKNKACNQWKFELVKEI